VIEGRDIVCFSNDWDADPLSKKHIMLRLAKKNRVLWVNGVGNRNPTASVRDMKRIVKKLAQFSRGCRAVAPNIWVLTPIVIPFHGNRLARWINRRLYRLSVLWACRKLRYEKPITWTYAPSSADVAGTIREKLIVYHCVDEFSKFTGADKAGIAEMERKLLEKADVVFVSSNALLETKRRENPNTFLVAHGVDYEHFSKACRPETPIPQDCAGLGSPVIGFFGLLADWVDFDVIRYLALARPAWSFLLIGEVQTDISAVRGLPNVTVLGRRDFKTLPGYSKKFDVAILPFRVNELTLAANPLKVREYIAAGLPVVATPLPEVRKLDGLVKLAATPEEFLERIDTLLAEGKCGPSLEVSRSMQSESWDARVEELSSIVDEIIRARARISAVPKTRTLDRKYAG
jgi:glycosyltransferase involved in cell wall biosynthesis